MDGSEIRSLNALTDPQRQIALDRYNLIEPFLKGSISLPQLCKNNNIPLRTARTWVSIYKKYGFCALARKVRVDSGKNRCMTPELRQLIEGLHLKSEHLSFSSIYRQVKTYQESKQLPYPKYRTVCILLNNLPKPMKTLAHKGSKAYSEKFDMIHTYEAERPNETWQADHVELDLGILNSSGKSQRPWLTIIFDDYSRGLCGYELSFMAPSAIKTALCLRMAIWHKKEPLWTLCGIPEKMYTDHGSDFTSKHIEQVCIDLKIHLIFSQIAQPRGRGKIERFFLTLNQLLISELPGYIKNKDKKPKLTLVELDVLIHAFIIQYNQNEHSETGFTPKERWEQKGFLPQMPKSIEMLDLLLLTIAKPRKVMRDGIHFQGLRYLDPVLADYIGESVIIRYDPSDLTSIRIFYKNKFLCQSTCASLDQHMVGLKEIQSARRARKQALRTQIKNRLSLVDAILNVKPKNTTITDPITPSTKKTKLKIYEADY